MRRRGAGSGPRLRTEGQRSLRVALLLLLAAAVLAAAALVALALTAVPDHPVVAAYPVVGLSYVVVGLAAWDRRPSNRTGPLLCVAGLTVLCAAAGNVTDPRVALAGAVVGQAPIAALLHLLLAFPSGRLGRPFDRALVAAGYLVTVGLQLPRLADLADVAERARTLQAVTGAAVLVLAAAVLWPRLRATARRAGQRRTLAGVYGYGAALLVMFPVTAQLVSPALQWSPVELFVVQLTGLAVAPYVFAAGVLAGAFARTVEVEELGAWLASSDGERPPLRDALARALGDDSLQLLFHRRGTGDLVDPDGRAASAELLAGRAHVDVTGTGGPAARIVYDGRLIADRTPVVAAGRVVALALERERLTAELLAGADELRSSRARVVQVADQERRRFAQDLHDVLQGRLLLAALHAGRLASLAPDEPTRAVASSVRSELDEAITEFRRLVHGVMPALLVERGLAAAAEALADRMPLPVHLDLDARLDALPPALSSTGYFILAEALANAVKHADASHLAVRVATTGDVLHLEVHDDGSGGAALAGAGLRGIAERVEAVDGRLEVLSPLGGGTRIVVELPCGS